MPLLRERASADALAVHHDQLAARRARAALERRLDQLEEERAAFDRTLVNVERAVEWLPDTPSSPVSSGSGESRPAASTSLAAGGHARLYAVQCPCDYIESGRPLDSPM
jgi:hypothetical protein